MHRLPRILGAIAAILATIAWSPFTPRDWPALKAQVRASFPKVRHITIAELDALRARERVVLLDTRAESEFAMSHIPGARHAPDERTARAILAAEGGAQAVLYCSVGYRSAKLADQLAQAGFERVANLEGSMFEWANAGRPIVQGEKPAATVHPYSRSWGKFLDRRLWPERW